VLSESAELAEVQLVDDTAQFYAPVSSDLVDGLVGQYQQMRARVEQVAELVSSETTGALPYFFDGNRSGMERHYPSAADVFKLPGAIAALNAAYWSKALNLTDVLDCMPQKRRDEWHKTISEHTTPDFEETTVRATITEMLGMRAQFLAERVDGIFRGLSGEHVTNAPEAFGKRMIVANVLGGYGYAEHRTCGLINDLRAVVAKFMGRDEPKWSATSDLVNVLKGHWGEWVPVDGGTIRIRLYRKGTAHMEVHPDMAWRLNQILAHMYPLAIPAEFRQKPKRKAKDFVMMGRPLPFAVLDLLGGMKPAVRFVGENRREAVPMALQFSRPCSEKAVSQAASRVLEAIGGVLVKPHGYYQFSYDAGPVVMSIVASGCIPDQQAHQFYPTPATVGEAVIDWADIGPEHTVLEPSAGQGALADLLPKDRTTCIEIAPLHCDILRAKGYAVHQADFIAWADSQAVDGPRFDRIVMNPPFSEGRAQMHTERAFDLLKPGGVLVAVLPSGMRGKDIFDGCEWSRLYQNEFAGTSVDVVLMRAQKEAA
jgi:hypothetical protein